MNFNVLSHGYIDVSSFYEVIFTIDILKWNWFKKVKVGETEPITARRKPGDLFWYCEDGTQYPDLRRGPLRLHDAIQLYELFS